ncbi:hypothetical protein ABZ783_07040 [Micromonospora sp. NPDC047738]|uniref:hypothetical protein n=1 Tax=Micromonospora sp. NPDC047738 TaxID=3155741 RepID=UPI0033F26A0D
MRAVKLLAAVALVSAMMGAEGGCKEGSNRPPTDKLPPKKPCAVTATVTDASGPYSVRMRASRVGTGLGDWRTDKSIAKGWSKKIVYECGSKIEVMMHVSGHPEDRFGCLIDDGVRNRDRRYGRKEVLCTLVTAQ